MKIYLNSQQLSTESELCSRKFHMVYAFIFEQLLHQKCKAPKHALRPLEEKSFNCHGGHITVMCDPLQASWHLCSGAHQYVAPNCCLFMVLWPIFDDPPWTLIWVRNRVGQLDSSGEPKVGCVWYLMMDQFLGWPILGQLLPWKQHPNQSLLLAPHRSALLSGKDKI